MTPFYFQKFVRRKENEYNQYKSKESFRFVFSAKFSLFLIKLPQLFQSVFHFQFYALVFLQRRRRIYETNLKKKELFWNRNEKNQ
jgi:hypothetical protein